MESGTGKKGAVSLFPVSGSAYLRASHRQAGEESKLSPFSRLGSDPVFGIADEGIFLA